MSYFETRFRHDPGKEDIWKVICDYFQRFIPEDSRLLDFGAGYCYFINNIKAREKHALDIDDVVLEYVGKDVKAHKGGIDKEFRDDYFDVVFSSNVLEHMHINEIFHVLGEIKRILKKNGLLILVLPNFKYSYRVYFDDYTHKTILTERSIKDILLGAGFRTVKISAKFLPFSTESRLKISPLLLGIYLKSPWKPFAGQMMVIARKP